MNQSMIRLALLSLMVWAAWPNAGQAQGTEPKAGASKLLPKCPVMPDEVIDPNVFIDTAKGQRVYFCCGGCIKKFNDSPQKYAALVKEQHKALQRVPMVQVACPVSGRGVDKKVSLEHQGKKVYFCCGKCPDAFKSDPAKYEAKLAGCYTMQTTCPVSGEQIDAGSSLALAGDGKLYFCCASCVKDFEKNRRKFGANLPSFYLCPMDECQDAGALGFSECPKCGMRRKQIGKGLTVKDAHGHG